MTSATCSRSTTRTCRRCSRTSCPSSRNQRRTRAASTRFPGRAADRCDLFVGQGVIPVGAPNTPAALAFLNFAYTPQNAAKITDYVQYVTPVNGVRPILQKEDPAVANDPKIFPTQQEIAPCS